MNSDYSLMMRNDRQGAFDYEVRAPVVDLTVIVTAYYNKYLNASHKETATETHIIIKNLKHIRNGEQIDLTWDVEGALPYEELEYVVSSPAEKPPAAGVGKSLKYRQV
ncbi:unnamed protein product [Haemonchus placei]|uniref:Fibronectin type III domain-containing protein n=1 Tax=Haemonchus placei TaxID=6290 RepID=A0A0N4WL70_HAEPC|nr:unnamed protein product [Haemonchus placei]